MLFTMRAHSASRIHRNNCFKQVGVRILAEVHNVENEVVSIRAIDTVKLHDAICVLGYRCRSLEDETSCCITQEKLISDSDRSLITDYITVGIARKSLNKVFNLVLSTGTLAAVVSQQKIITDPQLTSRLGLVEALSTNLMGML